MLSAEDEKKNATQSVATKKPQDKSKKDKNKDHLL